VIAERLLAARTHVVVEPLDDDVHDLLPQATCPTAADVSRPLSARIFLASSAPPKVPVSHPAAAATM